MNRILSASIFLLLGATSIGVYAQSSLKIGALVPVTGSLGVYGEASLNGINLAAKHVNGGGGINGRDLEIVLGDTQTNPQSGVSAAKRMVSIDGVSAIVGALSSGVTIPVASSISVPNKVIQISGASTAPSITTLDDNDYLFRTTPHDALQGEILAKVVKERGINSVSIIYVNNDYGIGLAEAFSNTFQPMGGNILSSVSYEEKQASYRGELAQVARDGNPSALVLIAYPGDGIPILKQALEEGYFERFVFTDGLKAQEVVDAIGSALDGSFGTAPEAAADSAASARFRKYYRYEFGELPPQPFIDTAYDATFLLALAALKAKSNDSSKIRDALREVANPPGIKILPGEWNKAAAAIRGGHKIDYEGAAGSQDFDDAGDVPGSFGVWEIQGGAIKTVQTF